MMRTIRGFSLIELSMVLVIIAFVVSAVLTLGTRRTVESKLELTEKRMDKIEEAIGAYLIRNNALPCPAPGGDAVAAVTFGVADCTNNVIAATPNIIVGTVPVVDLLLPDEVMFDGWGRRFTYMVEESFTTAAGFREVDPDTPKNGNIIVYAWGDDSTAPAPQQRTSTAVAVLISHGRNGHGAWLKNGGTDARLDAGSTDVAELENAHDPADDTAFDKEVTQMAHDSAFDDVVRYYERWKTIKLAGGIVDAEFCDIAYRTNMAYDSAASPPEGPVGCENEGGAACTAGGLECHCLFRQALLATIALKLCFISDPTADTFEIY